VAFHDVQLRYNFQKDWLDMTLFAGLNNVFNKYVEVGGTNGDVGTPTGLRTFAAEGFEPFGRAWYAGLKVDL
jgi:outer membrane receptor protein involved in Fe transport